MVAAETKLNVDGSFVSQCRNSFAWNRKKISTVRSWKYLVECLLLAVAALFTFNALEQAIYSPAVRQGTATTPQQLLIFDIRHGYSPREVAWTLRAWGKQGRLLYTVIEAVDIAVYIPAYRGAAMVAINRLSRSLAEQTSRREPRTPAATFPAVLGAVDYIEDVLQVSMTWLYNKSRKETPASWQRLVKVSSAVNKLKWALVKLGTIGIAVASLALVVLKVRERLIRRKHVS